MLIFLLIKYVIIKKMEFFHLQLITICKFNYNRNKTIIQRNEIAGNEENGIFCIGKKNIT